MKINITPEEFTSIIMIYLLDKINNYDEIIPNNDEFDNIFKSLEKIKSHLTRFYLNSDINSRIYYKRLRGITYKEGMLDNFTINIKKPNGVSENNLELNENEINKYELKDIVKQVIKTVKKRKFYKATYLSDEDLDKIIMKIIEKGEY